MTNPEERLRFTSITLKNWRNFADMTVALPRLAYLVGANGSGKSNFLDAIRFLHDLGAVGGGLRAAVGGIEYTGIYNRGGMMNLRHLPASPEASVTISAEIGNDANPRVWEYDLSFDGGRTPTILNEVVKHKKEVVFPENQRTRVKRGPGRPRTRSFFEQDSADASEVQEFVDFFDSIRYINVVPQIVRNPSSNSAGSNGAYGGALLEGINTDAEENDGRRLAIIADILSKIVPEIADLKAARGSFDVPRLYTFFKHAREGSKPLTEAVLSDGTLRLIGMLWSLLDGDGPLLLEEPEQSLHAGLVQYLPMLLGGLSDSSNRQLLVSTHSSDLLRSEGMQIEEVIVLYAEAGHTTIKPATQIEDVEDMLRAGESIADIVLHDTAPVDGDLITNIAVANQDFYQVGTRQ